MIRFARRLLLLGGCVLMSAVVCAHDVPVEQRVDMTMERHGGRLVVRMHIPATLLGKAPLQAVAANAARSLDVRQGETPLSAPTATAATGVDRTSTDVELTYRIDATANGISARLNGFQSAPMQLVRTTVSYLPASGPAQIVSVVGPATRVRFDPGALETFQDFIGRALRSVLTFGDHLLLLACLLIPVRSVREATRLFAALAAGQAVGIAAVAQSGSAPAFALTTAMVAASAVVVAAAQNIVPARVVLVAMLALTFGMLNGFGFGDAFAVARQFAGVHQAIAFVVFAGIVIAAEFWLGAVMWASRAWLDRRRVPDRMFAIVVSAFIAHTAVHDVIDRSEALAAEGSFAGERAVFWLTMAWVIVMLGVAAREWLRQPGVSGGVEKTAHSTSS